MPLLLLMFVLCRLSIYAADNLDLYSSGSKYVLHENNPSFVPVSGIRLRKYPRGCNRRVIQCKYQGKSADGSNQDEWHFVAVTTRDIPSSQALYKEIVESYG